MNQDPQRIHPDQLADHCGQVVSLPGRYRAEFDSPHKAVSMGPDGRSIEVDCLVVLLLDNGASAELYDRPAEEARRLNGKTVVVTGMLCPPDPPLQDDEGGDEVAEAMPLYSFPEIIGIEVVG